MRRASRFAVWLASLLRDVNALHGNLTPAPLMMLIIVCIPGSVLKYSVERIKVVIAVQQMSERKRAKY